MLCVCVCVYICSLLGYWINTVLTRPAWQNTKGNQTGFSSCLLSSQHLSTASVTVRYCIAQFTKRDRSLKKILISSLLFPFLFLFLLDPPEIVERPKDVAVRSGGMAAFYCRAKGEPSPQLSWRKNGRKVRVCLCVIYLSLLGSIAIIYSVANTTTRRDATTTTKRRRIREALTNAISKRRLASLPLLILLFSCG